ncbi:MAG: hypothetical protein AVDCRST_MAG33-3332, partial [uncultured Thermomicrobiales bacterium]
CAATSGHSTTSRRPPVKRRSWRRRLSTSARSVDSTSRPGPTRRRSRPRSWRSPGSPPSSSPHSRRRRPRKTVRSRPPAPGNVRRSGSPA